MRADLPCARDLSDLVFKGPDGLRNQRNLTTMFAFFAQVVAYEIMQSTEGGCPIEAEHVKIKPCDFVFDPECKNTVEIPK